jgi:hypothetical protein
MPLTALESADKTGLLATLRLDAIRDHHCTEINLASQMVGQLQTALEEQSSKDGACLAMSAKWLEGQKGGSPLLKELLGLGGAVNEKALSGIVETHKSIGGGPDKAHKFAKSLKGEMQYSTFRRFDSHSNDLGDALFDEKEGVALGPLILLGVYGGNLSHAMALDMTKHIFFDPNFGEFKFNSGANLKSFLNRVFTLEKDVHVSKWWYVRKKAYCTFATAWVYK